MRTLKFRVWDKPHKQFHFWGFHDELTGAWFVGPPNIPYGIQQQFTGLKDKNGKEIYEGDLVLFGAWDKPWKVDWNEELARFDLFWVQGGEEGWMTLCNEDEEAEPLDLKVIGNIHETPDLLEARE